MRPNQAPSNQPETPQPRPFVQAFQAARQVVIAALTAHAAVIVAERLDSPLLLTALTAALIYASVSFGLTLRDQPQPSPRQGKTLIELATAGLAFAGVFGGIWIVGLFAGTATEFYCTPLVPWRIEIAIFGSFAIGFVTAMAGSRGYAPTAYSLAIIGFAWMAPFYGFFSAPVLLALNLNTLCTDRPGISVALAALGMFTGVRISSAIAVWMSKG